MGWRGCWNGGGYSFALAHGWGEPLELHRRSAWRRRRQFLDNAVNHPADATAEPVEVQRAVLEVLLDPLRFLKLAAGRQAQCTPFIAERGPRVVDGSGERLGAGLRRPV